MSIARLKISLKYVKPPVLRRVEVPVGIRLSDLHLVIQAVMPWWNYHLYPFKVGDRCWGIPDPDIDFDESTLDAASMPLGELLASGSVKTMMYEYDFGDGWEHPIRVEAIMEPEPGVSYPRLLEAKR